MATVQETVDLAINEAKQRMENLADELKIDLKEAESQISDFLKSIKPDVTLCIQSIVTAKTEAESELWKDTLKFLADQMKLETLRVSSGLIFRAKERAARAVLDGIKAAFSKLSGLLGGPSPEVVGVFIDSLAATLV